MPTRSKLCAVLAWATACTTLASAAQVPLYPDQQADGRLLLPPTFAPFLDDIRKNGSIPGISIGVVRLAEDGEPLVQLITSGRKTEEGDGRDLTPDTLFGLASCSKAYLAASMGILMDDFAQGRNATPLPPNTSFNWDTKVADLVPEELGWSIQDLGGDNWAARKASIKDVLGHVSGFPAHDFSYRTGDSPEELVRRMGKLRAAYELREKWSYTNQARSYLVAHYAGRPYSEFARDRIFMPLNMSATTFSPSVAQASGRLTHTWDKDGRRIPLWATDEHTELMAAPAGLISSAEDVVKWLAVWLHKGVDPSSGVRIFPESVYSATTTAQRVVYGSPARGYGSGVVGYGMGWTRWSHGNVDVVQHNGGVPGFSIATAFSPSNNVGIVILANADEKGWWNQLILMKALDVVLGTSNTHMAELPGAQEEVKLTTSVAARTLSLPLSAYAGTYTSPGYSNISLCAPGEDAPSTYCTSVLADFSAVDSVNDNSTPDTSLYGAYTSVWASHVRMSLADSARASPERAQDVFAVGFVQLFPRGFGRDTTPFETHETGFGQGWAEFVIGAGGEVEGFAFVLDEGAYAARRRRAGPSVGLWDAADAWFVRV